MYVRFISVEHAYAQQCYTFKYIHLNSTMVLLIKTKQFVLKSTSGHGTWFAKLQSLT